MRIDLNKKITPEELATPIVELMTPFEFIFSFEATVDEVLQKLQSKSIPRHIDFFYIVDEKRSLLGVISTQELLYNTPETKLEDILDAEVLKLFVEDSLEKALKLIARHRLFIIPIVDSTNRFLGVLELLPTNSDIPHRPEPSLQKRLRDDFFQLMGFTMEQARRKSSWLEFRYRMPWLGCNLASGLICALIGEVFQYTLAAFVVLALFIPLILTLSESISIQAMTLSLRFIHLEKIRPSQIWRRLVSEWKASILLALACSLVIVGFYFIWSADLKPIAAIITSLFIAMVCSASFGALLPIALHLARLDPKVAAGPVSLMIADILTITVYLGISAMLLF